MVRTQENLNHHVLPAVTTREHFSSKLELEGGTGLQPRDSVLEYRCLQQLLNSDQKPALWVFAKYLAQWQKGHTHIFRPLVTL